MPPCVLLFLLILENRSLSMYPAEVTGRWRGGNQMIVLLSTVGYCLSYCLPIRFWAIATQKEGCETYNITSFVLTVTWRNSLLINGLWWAKNKQNNSLKSETLQNANIWRRNRKNVGREFHLCQKAVPCALAHWGRKLIHLPAKVHWVCPL